MGKFSYRRTVSLILFLLMIGMLAVTLPYQAEAAGKIVVTGTYVNVRTSGATSAKALAKVYQGEIYQVIKENKGWYYIQLKSGQKGWVAGWLTKSVVEQVKTNTKSTSQVGTNLNNSNTNVTSTYPYKAKITGVTVNLRAGTSTSTKSLKKLTRDTVVQVLGKQGDWLKVKLTDGKIGWLASWLVKAEPKTSTAVTIPAVSTPVTTIPVVSTPVVASPATSKPTQGSATQDRMATVKGTYVNLRSGPSTSYAVAGKAVKGDVVQVLQVNKDWYQVRLANGKIGWMASWLVVPITPVNQGQAGSVNPEASNSEMSNPPIAELVSNQTPTTNPSNWIALKVEKGTTTIVTISGNETLSYETSELQEPHRLVVKINNAGMEKSIEEFTVNSQGLLKVKASPLSATNPAVEISLELEPGVRWVAQAGADSKSLVLVNDSDQDSNQSANDPNGTSQEGNIPYNPAMRTVAIDAGHGGIDPGAVGPNKLQEKDVVFDISMRLGHKLEAAGYRVIYTRTDDTKISLARRPAIAAENNADIFVSIHANSSENPASNGTSTYYYAPASVPDLFAQEPERKRLAQTVQQQMLDAVGRKDLGIMQANFAVLRGSTMPSILVETAFICNTEEESLLAREDIRDAFASAIYKGINQYFEESPNELSTTIIQ